jgi:diguanylate cyclase (GGDEF)-like protein
MIAQALLDALPLGVLVTDQDLHVVQLNRWLVQRLSAAQLALVGEPLTTVFPELAEHNLLPAYQMVLQQGQPLALPTSVHRYVIRLPAPAGAALSEMAQATTIVPLFEAAAISGTLTLIQDVSQGLAAERHLQREIDRLSALHEIDRALATLDLPACLQIIVDRTRTLFGGANAALLLREGDRLRVAACAGYETDVVDRQIGLDEGVVGRVASQRRPSLVADVTLEPRYYLVEPRTRSEMAAPLKLHEECIGVLNVESVQVNAFSEDDLEMLEMLGVRAATAIHNARLHAAERQQRELAATLQDIGLTLATELDPQAILDTLLDHVVRVVPYDSACVLMLDAGGRDVWVERQRGYEKFGATQLVTSFRHEVTALRNLARMVDSRRPYVVPDVRRDPDWVPHETAAHIRSWAGAPIVARGRVLGFVSLDKVEPDFYTAALADRLAAFAAQAGLALENAHLYAEQQRLAVTDGLTGIGNRRYFDQALARELQRAFRFQRTTALIMLDLDDFKVYNDTYGHLAGDELLQAVAITLAQSLRSADIAARYGGEEFVIILPETDLEAAAQAAERLRELVEHLPLRPGQDPSTPVTISLGVSAAPMHALTPAALVNAADMAMYQAKARGKNQAVSYDDSLVAATSQLGQTAV